MSVSAAKGWNAALDGVLMGLVMEGTPAPDARSAEITDQMLLFFQLR